MFRTLFCTLLLLTVQFSVATLKTGPLKEIELEDFESFERQLASAGCNETLGDVTVEDVKRVGKIFLDPLVEDAELSTNILFQTAIHDFRVYKLCSSCHFINIYYYEINDLFPVDYFDFCGNETYGYKKFQSFLVFIPLDKETGDIISGVKLRAFISLHDSRPEEGSAPTEAWPTNLTETLEAVQSGELPNSTFRESSFSQFVTSMLAASSGSVSILPDYHGYGRSEMNQTFMWPDGYKQSTIVAWLHVREFFYRYAPCTQLDLKAVTLQGFDDGAMGAVHVAQVFRRFSFKTRTLRLFSGTGLLDLDNLISNAIRTVGNGGSLRGRVRDMLRMATFTFSFGHPNLANTGKGQDMVSEGYREVLMNEFVEKPAVASPAQRNLFDPSLVTAGGDFFFMNPDLLDFYVQSIQADSSSQPCRADLTGTAWEAKVGDLCKAIADASAWPTLLGQGPYNWIHDMEVCYSPDDLVISPEQVELVDLVANVSLIERYDGPFGETTDTLKPVGSKHSLVKNICGISAGLFYVYENHRPSEVRNYPYYMPPLDFEVGEACGVTYNSDPAPTSGNAPNVGLPPVSPPSMGDLPTNEPPSAPTDQDAPSANSADPPAATPPSASSLERKSFFVGIIGAFITFLL